MMSCAGLHANGATGHRPQSNGKLASPFPGQVNPLGLAGLIDNKTTKMVE
jgi:hypothetical protein